MRLFTKTCRKDFPWMELAVASVTRRCKERRLEWTIVCDRGERDALGQLIGQIYAVVGRPIRTEIFEVQDKWADADAISRDGYITQQWVKMNAHRVMPAGYFLNWDSDCMAIGDFTERSFMDERGKPILYFTPFNDIILSDPNNRKVHEQRREFVRQTLAVGEVSYEWMRTMPIWMHTSVLKAGEDRGLWNRASINMRSRMEGVSEFCLIGQVAQLYFPDLFEYRNTQNGYSTWGGGLRDVGKITHQAWSWGGVKDDHRQAAFGELFKSIKALSR